MTYPHLPDDINHNYINYVCKNCLHIWWQNEKYCDTKCPKCKSVNTDEIKILK